MLGWRKGREGRWGTAHPATVLLRGPARSWEVGALSMLFAILL